MNTSHRWYAWRDQRLELLVHVQPRARRTEVAGLHGERLKLRLAAPPVDGAANEALCGFIAEAFGVARTRVKLVSGATGRDKRIEIEAPKSLPDWYRDLGGAASG